MSTPSPATTIIAMPTVPTATAAVAASTIPAPETAQSQYDCDNVPDVFSGAVKGAKLYQEDSFATIATPSNRTRIGAVFDGHGGYNGLLASQTARDYCRHYFISRIGQIDEWSVAEWQSELIRLFAEMHAAIRHKFMADTTANAQNANGSNNSAAHNGGNGRFLDEKGIVRASNGDPIHGGSTATVVVMKVIDDSHATIITANVGDSTAILMPSSSAYEFLSVDHGPENDDEFERVHSLPNQTHPLKLLFVYDKTTVFRKYECPLVFSEDGTKDNAYVSNPWAHGLHPTNVRYEPAVYAVTPKTRYQGQHVHCDDPRTRRLLCAPVRPLLGSVLDRSTNRTRRQRYRIHSLRGERRHMGLLEVRRFSFIR